MKRFPILGALMFGAALTSANTSHAQTAANQKAPVVSNGAIQTGIDDQITQIRVRTIPVEFAAYWLDPIGQPMPQQIQSSQGNGGTNPLLWAAMQRRRPEPMQTQRVFPDPFPRQAGSGYGPRDLTLPEGVEIVGAIAPKNILLVKGTKEGIAAIRALLDEIAVPLNRVEIEAQIIEIAPASLQSLPLVFRDNVPEEEKTPMLGDQGTLDAEGNSINFSAGSYFARAALAVPISAAGPLTQKLNEGIANNSIRVITAPRVTAIDGLTAKLVSTESRGIYLGEATKTADATEQKAENSEPISTVDTWQEGSGTIESQTGFTATPVLHGDLIKLGFRVILNNNVTAGDAVMRDGQTLAVRLPDNNPRTGWPRIALIKTNLIRRAQ